MFRFEKKKVQLRSVEDYLRSQDLLGGDAPPKPPQRPKSLGRVKALVGPALGVLFILVLVGAALSQFNGLRSEIAALKDQKSEEVKELDLRLADVSARADKSEKRATQLAEKYLEAREGPRSGDRGADECRRGCKKGRDSRSEQDRNAARKGASASAMKKGNPHSAR